MPYIYQAIGDRRCGAYALAYWKWKDEEEQGIPFSMSDVQAENYVQSIYNQIVFNTNDLKYINSLGVPGINVNELSGFSAPSKICVYLDASDISRELGTKAVVYTSRSNIFNLLGKIGNITKTDQLDDLETGEKAILLVSNDVIPRHYIFAYGSNDLDADGHAIMHIIDPSNGIDIDTGANIRNWKGVVVHGTNFNFLDTFIKFGHDIV